MRMKVLILHAYSASNLGDGLLVREALSMVGRSFGENAEVTIFASHPESFSDYDVRVFNSAPHLWGYDLGYLKNLWGMNRFDCVIAVGGGYLRAGTVIEAFKMILVHGPQIATAAFRARHAVYLPQSIGPAFGPVRGILRKLLARLGHVWVRDDRSLKEFASSSVRRSPDLAILGMNRASLIYDDQLRTVLTVRYIGGELTKPLKKLRSILGSIDSFVQSSVASNNDVPAVMAIEPVKILSSNELIESPSHARVVIAVRLHAALMAIAAGHYVIHLSYERKGYGAFQDLGLDDFVFNVKSFSPHAVAELSYKLRNNADLRSKYDQLISSKKQINNLHKTHIMESMRTSAKTFNEES